MNINISFSVPNPEFSQEIADALHNGEDSDENPRYKWIMGYDVPDVVRITEEENVVFTLRGKFVDSGKEFAIDVAGMRVFRFFDNTGFEATFAISEELIKNDSVIRSDSNGKRYYYISLFPALNPHFDFALVADGIFIAKNSIPKEFLPA